MKTTKEEIIGVVFSKLRPTKKDIFADIGCGVGNVAKFFSDYVKFVYAVDNDGEIIEEAKKNLKNCKNVKIIVSDGYDFLKDYEYDIAFFGGTKGINDMLEVCKARRVAVNAARIEVAVEVMEKMKKLGIFKEILIVNISKSYKLAGLTAFKNLNPVFIIFGERIR